tara:strand:- start:464 stop:724 length:261 start_codon:yes stop_codon:yes gene_type:complete
MPNDRQTKNLLLDSIKLAVSNKALRVISETKEPDDLELDAIAVRHMRCLFVPKAYEKLKGDWEWAIKKQIPITLKEALDYMDDIPS